MHLRDLLADALGVLCLFTTGYLLTVLLFALA